jgi:Putative exonuclease SbcCD, C subunit
MFAGKDCTMDELRQILSEDVSARQMLVDAREREILENHLIGKVSGHLHELLHAAEEQVRQMNDELESRPTSTGMKLRFVWRPAEDAPSGMSEARERLMQSNGIWPPAERQMLGSFLQRQIQAAGPDIEQASWQEALADALDYRKWHRFGVERYQDGVWKRLTRRTHGTGSGGEKAVALTLPHFAAAAAFYRTAHPLAPRLILLDEAFVGIDADMRAKCMGLIHTFDLDFMMTSEREWGCYQTLPGLAIYQLSTRPDIDAVGLTRWVWNGRQRDLHSSEPAPDLVAIGSP